MQDGPQSVLLCIALRDRLPKHEHATPAPAWDAHGVRCTMGVSCSSSDAQIGDHRAENAHHGRHTVH